MIGNGRVVKISVDGDERADTGGEAAGARSNVEDALTRPEVRQDFVHRTVLTVVGRWWLVARGGQVHTGI
jgi:hypothetical protein